MAEYKLWRLTADMVGDYTADGDFARLPTSNPLAQPYLRHGATINDPYAWIVEDFDGGGHITAIPPAATRADGHAILCPTYITPEWKAVSAYNPYGWQGNLAVWECDLAVRVGETWANGRYFILGVTYNTSVQYSPHLIVAGTAALLWRRARGRAWARCSSKRHQQHPRVSVCRRSAGTDGNGLLFIRRQRRRVFYRERHVRHGQDLGR